MKPLIYCVLSFILLSFVPAFALSIEIPMSEAQKIRESYRLFISSKKVALERLEKYGFMDIKNSGKHECFMDDEVFSCIVIHPYGFVMKDDVFTKIDYSFNTRFSSTQSISTTLSKEQKAEIVNVLNMVTDDPQMSEEIINELVREYHLKVANKESIEKGWSGYSAYLNYRGILIELVGSEDSLFYLYVN